MDEVFKQLSERELELLNIIQEKGNITKKDLQEITDIKLTTLNRAMKNLEDNNLIVEVGTSESTGGRKAIEYAVAERGVYVVGVDISRTYVKIILSNLRMDILKNEEFSLDYSFSPEKTLEKIAYLIKQFLDDLLIDRREILGIGIGTVGPLDREKGIILNPKGFLHTGWSNVPVKDMLESRTAIPCFIDNGANTAGLAEYSIGKGKGLKSVVYIHCGVGIRSAVITNGIIIRTMNDSEDAFAHMVIEVNGEKCACGNKGCIESYASLETISKKLKSRIKEEACLEGVQNQYKEILNLYKDNNETVVEIINRGAEILGVGIANLVRILNPELVVLSGPLIMNHGSYYDTAIEAFYKSNCMNNKVEFSKGGELQKSAIAMGAGFMVIDYYLKTK